MSCENWIVLKEDSDYEINDHTLQIRRKTGKKRIIKECVDKSDGYIRINLNSKKYRKHRIIANNFIENPNNYEFVDHIDHDRTNNSISNLRWVSKRMNNNNRSDQTFVDEIPDDSILVEKYNNHEFEFLYFHDDIFYFYNGINYTIKPKMLIKQGSYTVKLLDINGKECRIYYNKFKREYGLI